MTYPTEIRAQALALAIQGYSARRIERAIGVNHETIAAWVREAPEIRQEQRALLAQATVENVLQADAEMSRLLDHLETLPPQELVKHGLLLNAVSGTGKDKLVAFERAPNITLNADKAVIIIERAE